MAAGNLHEVCDVGNKGDYGQHDRLDSTLVTEIWEGRLGQNLQEMLGAVRAPGFSFMLLGRSFKTIEFLLIYRGQQTPHTRKGCFSSPSMCQSSIPWFHLKCALSQKYFIRMCTLRYSFPELVQFVTYRIYWFNFLVSKGIVSYCM